MKTVIELLKVWCDRCD